MKHFLSTVALLVATLATAPGVHAAGFISQKSAEPKPDRPSGEKDGREGEKPGEKGEREGGDKGKPDGKGERDGDDKVKPAPDKPRESVEPRKTFPEKPKTEVEQAVEQHFLRYDKDGNGKLSLAEFRTAYRGSDMGEGPKLFQERDGDKDGFLSREEFGRIQPKKILSATEQDRIEGRDWKEEREQRQRERERKNDRR